MALQIRSYGKVQVLEIHGRFDAHMEPEVREWLINNRTPFIVVNLVGVHFIDSGGLAALLSGMKRNRQQSGDLRICHLQPSVRIIFELTRMVRAFDVYDNEAEAVSSFEK